MTVDTIKTILLYNFALKRNGDKHTVGTMIEFIYQNYINWYTVKKDATPNQIVEWFYAVIIRQEALLRDTKENDK